MLTARMPRTDQREKQTSSRGVNVNPTDRSLIDPDQGERKKGMTHDDASAAADQQHTPSPSTGRIRMLLGFPRLWLDLPDGFFPCDQMKKSPVDQVINAPASSYGSEIVARLFRIRTDSRS